MPQAILPTPADDHELTGYFKDPNWIVAKGNLASNESGRAS